MPTKIRTIDQFNAVVSSEASVVVTDAARHKGMFHPNPGRCMHIADYLFVEKVVTNGERNGSYFVATLPEAQKQWPKLSVCRTCAATTDRLDAEEPDLCRGWTASKIKQALELASEPQREIILVIAENSNITTAEVADKVGLDGYQNVAAHLAHFTMATAELDIRDSRGEPTWPFETRSPATGSNNSTYFMPAEAAAVVKDALGRS